MRTKITWILLFACVLAGGAFFRLWRLADRPMHTDESVHAEKFKADVSLNPDAGMMGVDMPTHEELIAHNKTAEEICAYMGADSLHYLSLDGMMAAIAMDSIGSQSGYCNACFTGVYPFPLGEEVGKGVLEMA